ncbi:MAG: ABC transporter substrate-binding protein [Chloroflexi bacterium]|nr:ABC transporter substrate-binding protein [Chloroflexota bacterium]
MKATIELPANTYALPIFLAKDKNYFAKAGVDLNIVMAQGSTAALLPVLARGDIDMLLATPAPPFYNQLTQGFDIKAFTSVGQEKEGRLAGASLMVVKKDADTIKDFPDLKGKIVDGAAEGGPAALIAVEAIKKAGLTPGKDVTLQYSARSAADMLALAKTSAADAISMNEPTATQAVAQGLAVRWKTLAQVAPWYQPSFLAASNSFLQAKPAALEKFLEVLLVTEREVDAANGDWTPELIASDAKWTSTPPDVIKSQGGVVYYDPNGGISLDALSQTQDEWAQSNLVKQKIDVSKAVDTTALDKALAAVGKV